MTIYARKMCVFFIVLFTILIIAFGLICTITAKSSLTTNKMPVFDIQEHLYAKSLQNSMIWSDSAPSGKQVYTVFRKTFDLEAIPAHAFLRIFADTRYMLWVNGSYVERGPCRFDPKRPEYDVLDVTRYLNEGKNVIAVLVHHYAINSFKKWFLQCARIMHHEPGLTARLDILLSNDNYLIIKTDNTWKVNSSTRFLPSSGTYSSIFDNIDCRLERGDWSDIKFDDWEWKPAVIINGNSWGTFHPRSIPLPKETTIIPKTIVQESVGKEVINRSQSLINRLPLRMKQGHQLVIDVGKTVQGYSVLEFDADEGSILEVEYASRFFETKNEPHSVIFGRDEIARHNHYIARYGHQSYISGDTFGFKYLVLKVTSGNIRLNNVKVINRLYPFIRLGCFASGDTVLNRIWDVCVNTVEVCSEDAYVDCADRERAQWIADGYLTSYPVSRVSFASIDKNNNYCYSDPRLLKNMLRHMGLSQFPDGRLQPMRPSDYPPENKHGVIPDYSCLWVQAVRELYDRSGENTLIYELWQNVVKAMDYFLDRRTENGLVKDMEFVFFKNPLAYEVCEGATLNAYLFKSLLDAAYLGNRINDVKTAKRFEDAAEQLHKNYNMHFWDSKTGSYHGSIMNGIKTQPTGHAALLALYFDLVPHEKYKKVLNFMLEQFEKENPFPYTYRFFIDVLYRQNTKKMDMLALNTIRYKWAHMTHYETQTTSEAWNGGSFIHSSGSHPAYFLSSFVLGVRTEFKENNLKLIIQPRLGDLARVEGIVLTEYGQVPVKWIKNETNLNFQFEVPQGVIAEISIPFITKNPDLTVNGMLYVENGKVVYKNILINERYIHFHAPPGKYSGTISIK